MKKQLLYTLLIVVGLASIFAFKNTSHTPRYARLVSYIDGTMVMEYEDNTSETIKAGQVKTLAKLNQVSAKGYKLVSSHGGDKYHVYVFEKQ